VTQMLKLQLRKSYQQSFWDSSNGVTIARGEVVEADENNWVVKHALETGILEVVSDKSDELNIITDVPQQKTISEVVTADKIKSNKEAIDEAKKKVKDVANTKPADKDN
jgi:hypothetical protein